MSPSTLVRTPRRLRAFLAALLLLGTFTAASTLMPAPAMAQSDDQIEQAKEQFFAGQESYANGDFDAAAQSFLKAYKLSDRAELLYNVGKSYWKAKKLQKAQDYFQQYINAMPEAPNASEVVESIIEIQQEMAAQMASVDVTSSTPGLDVFVTDEEEPRCKTPCAVSLAPGERTLSVHPPGAAGPITQTVSLKAEEQTSMHFDLPGQLRVRNGQRSGTLKIADVGTYPIPMSAPISVPAGTHTLTITGADGANWSGSAQIRAGELTEISVPLKSPEVNKSTEGISTLRTVSFALAGLAVGLGAGGAVMGMQASDTHDSLAKRQSALGSVDPALVDQGRSQQLSSNILYAASAASLLAGAGLFTWDLMSDEDADEIPASEPVAEPASQPTQDPASESTSKSADDKAPETSAETDLLF